MPLNRRHRNLGEPKDPVAGFTCAQVLEKQVRVWNRLCPVQSRYTPFPHATALRYEYLPLTKTSGKGAIERQAITSLPCMDSTVPTSLAQFVVAFGSSGHFIPS